MMENNVASRRPVRPKKIQRKSISLSLGLDAVSYRSLFVDSDLITLIEPKIDGVDLGSWVNTNLDFFMQRLHQGGAVLFRGFKLKSDQDFQEFTNKIPFKAIDASVFEESTPRKKILDGVYTTTSFPCEETIALHSDYSPSMMLAGKICFFCVQPSEIGGETPIADTRKVLQRLKPEVSKKFNQLGWSLVRNYSRGLGLSWQDTFNGKNKSEVERHCREKNIDIEWDGDYLKTTQVRSAIFEHPSTKEACWFNHMSFWHVDNLPTSVKNSMLEQVGEEFMPFSTYFGDGSEISEEIAHEIRDALLAEKKMFRWQKGDVLIADNILTCHGREPFEGERMIRTALFDKFMRPDFLVDSIKDN
jgi:hypothetical protein